MINGHSRWAEPTLLPSIYQSLPPASRKGSRMAFGFACFVGLAFSFPDRTAEETARSLHVPEGYEVTVFAAEPMVVNPTAVEVDSRGRVWVTEGLNYRFFANQQFKRVP